jgi:hypothetical protein
VHRYLNTLGSWSSYRDLSRPEDIPQRLADLTAAFFGLDGLGSSGLPKVTGILGAIMAVHALEQISGSLATFGVRLLLSGEPLGHAPHRGVILRRSPLTPRTVRAMRWLIDSRLVDADGVYFFESGRTWHNQTVTVALWNTHRTLTHLRSLSLPYREFYFDREVAPQTLVDLAKGDRGPDSIPGFIGSVNELENSTSLGYLKRAFFAANWLLVEPGERDDGSPGPVDYEALIRRNPPGNGGLGGSGYSRTLFPSPFSGSGGTRPSGTGRPASSWPSTAHYVPVVSIDSNRMPGAACGASRSIPLRPIPEPVIASVPPPVDDPYLRIKARYQRPDGRHHPLLIRGITTNPITLVKKVDAIYYDGDIRRWCEIVDDDARVALAQDVETGTLKVTADWQHQL